MYPNFTEVYSILRKLSRNNYWQTIYSQSKECSGLKLFQNDSDYTNFQIMFLSELSKFSSICMDVAMNEVSELVLKKETYQNAYLFYKYHKRRKKAKKRDLTESDPQSVDKNYHKEAVVNQNQWVFTKIKGKK